MKTLIFLTLMSIIPLALAERLRVPEYVQCERDQLTSWQGSISHYQRQLHLTTMVINTEYGTQESLSITHDTLEDLLSHFFINGQVFATGDLAKIETDQQNIKAGVDLVVWVCSRDTTSYTIDWRTVPSSKL